MIDWSILRSAGPVDIAGNFTRGFDIGSQLVDKYHERNALASLASNPNDQGALSTLYTVNPALGGAMESRMAARATAARAEADRQRQAQLGKQYTTDPQGAQTAAVAAGDFDLAKTFNGLDEDAQKRSGAFWEKAGPVAYRLKQIKDPAQRLALWQQAKPILVSELGDSTQLEQFDPTNETQLDAAITTAQKVSDLIEQNKITWNQQGDQPSFATDAMGNPVGSANPYRDGAAAPQPSAGTVGGSAEDILSRNNPGALRKPGSMEFQSFGSEGQGIAAQEALLGRYMQAGRRSVGSIVEHYAPRQSVGGDNTDAQVNNYIGYVSQRLGVNPQDALSPAMLPKLAQAMREFETGHGKTSAPMSGGGPVEVASKADFDRLPSGAEFIAPDGTHRRKP